MYRLLSLLTLAVVAQAQPPALPPRYESLAAAEREFAADGLRDGVQKAFIAHFAVDALVLRPFATPAPAWYREHPDGPGKLVWTPQYLAVSAADDLGLSSGPWRYEAERDGKPVVAHGHFFSIWQRDAQGRWQVLFDHGISHAAAPDTVENNALAPIAIAQEKSPSADVIDARKKLLNAADDALRERLGHDPRSAYAAVATAQTLWLRDGAIPARGIAPPAAGAEQACGCGPRTTATVAASGDLGYTLGGADSVRARGVDVRVWQFERNAWRLLADLTAAVP
jgi:ketosteroid isomerase-like protein